MGINHLFSKFMESHILMIMKACFLVQTNWFSLQNMCHVGLASICHFLVLDPNLKGLGTNSNLSTNNIIAWIHWCMGLGPSSKVALSLLPKLVEKLVWVPVISFCKISFLVMHLMPYYAKTGCSRPPNHLTLQTTLLLPLQLHEWQAGDSKTMQDLHYQTPRGSSFSSISG